MADETDKSALEQIAAILQSHRVEFIVIGGQAELLHGSPRVTYDVDVCYHRSVDNLKRLVAALKQLQPSLRNAPADLPFRIDEQSLALGCNFTFTTRFGDFDLIGYLEPLGDYLAVSDRAIDMHVGRLDLRVIHIDDLIAIREHLGRPKDKLSLYQLQAIKKIQSDG